MVALEYGLVTVGLSEILAVTTTTNLRSQAVMQRIGMTYDPAEDFDAPEAEEPGIVIEGAGWPFTTGLPIAEPATDGFGDVLADRPGLVFAS